MKTRCFKFFFFGIIAFAALTLAVMLLWNALIPSIFGLATISYWQALGLFVLARILLGGFWRGRGPFGHHHHKHNPIHEKWARMSPEQRKEFVAKRHSFGFKKHFFDDLNNEESGDKE